MLWLVKCVYFFARLTWYYEWKSFQMTGLFKFQFENVVLGQDDKNLNNFVFVTDMVSMTRK